jgi:hypothetical protein
MRGRRHGVQNPKGKTGEKPAYQPRSHVHAPEIRSPDPSVTWKEQPGGSPSCHRLRHRL